MATNSHKTNLNEREGIIIAPGIQIHSAFKKVATANFKWL